MRSLAWRDRQSGAMSRLICSGALSASTRPLLAADTENAGRANAADRQSRPRVRTLAAARYGSGISGRSSTGCATFSRTTRRASRNGRSCDASTLAVDSRSYVFSRTFIAHQ